MRLPNRRTPKKINMQQPADGRDYEAEAKAYFESLHQPFEKTLEAIRKNYPKLVLRIVGFIAGAGTVSFPFCWTRVTLFVFHQNTYTFWGKPQAITETAVGIFFVCLFGTMLVGGPLGEVVRKSELKSAADPLSPGAMAFVLSYAIERELENLHRSNLPHHRQTVVELWTMLLTYLRWTLYGITIETAHFHALPPTNFLLAPQAEHFAEALRWNEVRKTEYHVIVALNSLHPKISPRLQQEHDYRDLPKLKGMFLGMGNFFYSSIVGSGQRAGLNRIDGEELASWGYSELLRAVEILNDFTPIIAPQSPPRAPILSPKVFMHSNIAVAFIAWWTVFQALFVVLIAAAFRFFPTLTMNSQAIVGLIAAPMAAAISMVGNSRRSS